MIVSPQRQEKKSSKNSIYFWKNYSLNFRTKKVLSIFIIWIFAPNILFIFKNEFEFSRQKLGFQMQWALGNAIANQWWQVKEKKILSCSENRFHLIQCGMECGFDGEKNWNWIFCTTDLISWQRVLEMKPSLISPYFDGRFEKKKTFQKEGC